MSFDAEHIIMVAKCPATDHNNTEFNMKLKTRGSAPFGNSIMVLKPNNKITN